MKKLYLIVSLLAVTLLSGCYGSIETGNVGLRKDFNGTINHKLEGEGIYSAFLSSVDQYSAKEIPVNLENLKPKAKDNLSLQELDVTVYYKVNETKIRDLAVKRTGQSVKPEGSKEYWPAYRLVESVSLSEAADAVSKIDSLVIHTQRDALAKSIKDSVQASLNESDPNTFTITRVVIRQVKTDQTIEQSIRNVVAKEKEFEAAQLNVKVAKSNAEATQQTAMTLTPAFLQHEYNQVLAKFAEKGGTVILDGSASPKMLNIKQ